MQSNQTATGPALRDQRVAGITRWLLCALVLPLLSTGCKPNKRYDLIEAELRTRDRELTETRAALEQARNLNRAYAQQAQQTAQSGGAGPSVPVYVPVKDITLARGTGGLNGDGVPGDDGLMVVIVPRDEDGAAVKVPARVEIAAWDVNTAGLKTPIGSWTIAPEKVRPTWRSGFISTGYFIAVPWQTRPCTEKVRVAVRLTTLDGRVFEADRDIAVKLMPGRAGPVPAPGPQVPPSPREPLLPDPLPQGVEELPPPNGVSERSARLLPPPGKP
jgi:hypothetical protein